MKAVVAAFNQEKALVGAFSVITNLRMELFEALITTQPGFCGAAGEPQLGGGGVWRSGSRGPQWMFWQSQLLKMVAAPLCDSSWGLLENNTLLVCYRF